MMMKNTPAPSSAPKRASRLMNSSAATTLIHQPKPKLELASMASRVPVQSPAINISAVRRMTMFLLMMATAIWKVLRGISLENLA
jgi:hypothetical protein